MKTRIEKHEIIRHWMWQMVVGEKRLTGKRVDELIDKLEGGAVQGLDFEKVLNLIFDFGQLTSKYPDKSHLLPGDTTFVSFDQYRDLAQAIVSSDAEKREQDAINNV